MQKSTKLVLALVAALSLSVPAVASAHGADKDHDKVPDRWEKRYKVRSVEADRDRDGLSVLGEYLSGTSPRSADSDGDGIRDGDEDRDGDGLTNAAEIQLGTNPAEIDSDNDGIPDGEEDADLDGIRNEDEEVAEDVDEPEVGSPGDDDSASEDSVGSQDSVGSEDSADSGDSVDSEDSADSEDSEDDD